MGRFTQHHFTTLRTIGHASLPNVMYVPSHEMVDEEASD